MLMSPAAQQETPVDSPPAPSVLVLTKSAPAVPGAKQLHDLPDAYIVLTWLIRLRWFALLGQGAAIAIAALALRLQLPLVVLLVLMAVTAVTNVALVLHLRRPSTQITGLVPAVVVLDVILLTGMLAATGGSSNPFCELYLIHVAMAVVVLPARWTWTIVGLSVACFAMLFFLYVPLSPAPPADGWIFSAGALTALAITAGLIAYFIGRLRATLRQREEQMSAMQSLIEQSDRLAGLTTLAAGAAHELGTPLGTIALIAHELDRMAGRLQLPEAAIDDIRLIRHEVNRCRSILDRMNIDNLHRSDESVVSLPIADLIEDVRGELKPGQAAMLDISIGSSVSTVVVPRAGLVQTLGILIQNAFDASEETGTRVRLSVDRENKPPAQLRFTIEDRGKGMTAEQMKRLGEPFVTTKGPQRGMGLGLFLARLMAQHLRGSLVLQSAVGKGTTSVLTLPVS
jgi:two-component system sensor histidine kinase RegB